MSARMFHSIRSAKLLAPCLVWVKTGNPHREHIGSAVPPKAAVLLHRSERQLRAKKRHRAVLSKRRHAPSSATIAVASHSIGGLVPSVHEKNYV